MRLEGDLLGVLAGDLAPVALDDAVEIDRHAHRQRVGQQAVGDRFAVRAGEEIGGGVGHLLLPPPRVAAGDGIALLIHEHDHRVDAQGGVHVGPPIFAEVQPGPPRADDRRLGVQQQPRDSRGPAAVDDHFDLVTRLERLGIERAKLGEPDLRRDLNRVGGRALLNDSAVEENLQRPISLRRFGPPLRVALRFVQQADPVFAGGNLPQLPIRARVHRVTDQARERLADRRRGQAFDLLVIVLQLELSAADQRLGAGSFIDVLAVGVGFFLKRAGRRGRDLADKLRALHDELLRRQGRLQGRHRGVLLRFAGGRQRFGDGALGQERAEPLDLRDADFIDQSAPAQVAVHSVADRQVRDRPRPPRQRPLRLPAIHHAVHVHAHRRSIPSDRDVRPLALAHSLQAYLARTRDAVAPLGAGEEHARVGVPRPAKRAGRVGLELRQIAAGIADRQEVVLRRALGLSFLPVQLLQLVRRQPEFDGALGRHLVQLERDHGGLGSFHPQRPAEAAFLDVHALVAQLDRRVVLLEVGQQDRVGVGDLFFAQHVVGVVGEVERRGDVRVVEQQVGGLVAFAAANLDGQVHHADVAGDFDLLADELPLPGRLAHNLAQVLPALGRLAGEPDHDASAALGPDAERVRRIRHDLQRAQAQRSAASLDRQRILPAVRVAAARQAGAVAQAPRPTRRDQRILTVIHNAVLEQTGQRLHRDVRPELKRPVGQEVGLAVGGASQAG